MTDNSLFSGRFFEYTLTQAPLAEAEFFEKGSYSMLYRHGSQLYRLTRDGGCHVFLAIQSAQGCSSVVEIKQDFGPVAPSDEDNEPGYYYWLAEVEWLEPLDPEHPQTQCLQSLFESLDYEPGCPSELPALAEQCRKTSEQFPEFASLLLTLAEGCQFVQPIEGDVDLDIGNVMRRPLTGELVWTDPLCAPHYLPQGERLSTVETVRRKLEQK